MVSVIYNTLTAAGLPVLDRRVPGYKNLSYRPSAVLVHHTASRGPTNLPSLNVCQRGRSDLPGPLCQILIGRQGTICAITDGYANHAGRVVEPWSNYNLVGVELENNGVGEPYPEAQLSATRKVIRALGFPTVLGHKEICVPSGRKIDPSFDMHAFRASLSLEEEVLKEDERNAVLNVNHWVLQCFRNPAFPTPNHQPVNLPAELAAIRAEVSALKAGSGVVDVAALARAVADELHRRMAQ